MRIYQPNATFLSTTSQTIGPQTTSQDLAQAWCTRTFYRPLTRRFLSGPQGQQLLSCVIKKANLSFDRSYAVGCEEAHCLVEGVCNTPLQQGDFTTDHPQLRNSYFETKIYQNAVPLAKKALQHYKLAFQLLKRSPSSSLLWTQYLQQKTNTLQNNP